MFSTHTLIMAQSDGNLSVGAARVNITPPENVSLPMSGYANRSEGYIGIHDSLYYRVIVMADGQTKAAIVVGESIAIMNNWWQEISERIQEEVGIPRDNLLLAATHTHAAPTPIHRLQTPDENMKAYSRNMADKIILAVQTANASLEPARMGVGRGYANININRTALTPEGGYWLGRNPDGPSDKTVHVVKFEKLNNEPIAILVNYGVHGVVGGQENLLISGDVPGAISRYVENQYDKQVTVPWTSSAAGDQNPIDMITKGNLNNLGRVPPLIRQGMIVGEEVMRVADNMERMTRWGNIIGMQDIVTVPGKERNEYRPTGNYEFVEADSLDIRLSLLRINNVVFTCVSGEVLTGIGKRLKEESPIKETIMITHCNGSVGYLADDDAYENPGYEIMSSRAMEAENAIIDGFMDLIDRVAEKEANSIIR